MTTMLHQGGDSSGFDERRQLGELATLVSSDAGRTYLAEGYTGWAHKDSAPSSQGPHDLSEPRPSRLPEQ